MFKKKKKIIKKSQRVFFCFASLPGTPVSPPHKLCLALQSPRHTELCLALQFPHHTELCLSLQSPRHTSCACHSSLPVIHSCAWHSSLPIIQSCASRSSLPVILSCVWHSRPWDSGMGCRTRSCHNCRGLHVMQGTCSGSIN